jgi:hypothetical protein
MGAGTEAKKGVEWGKTAGNVIGLTLPYINPYQYLAPPTLTRSLFQPNYRQKQAYNINNPSPPPLKQPHLNLHHSILNPPPKTRSNRKQHKTQKRLGNLISRIEGEGEAASGESEGGEGKPEDREKVGLCLLVPSYLAEVLTVTILHSTAHK